MAIQCGFDQVLTYLMELGCSVEVASFGGMRPLHHACNKNLERVIRTLLKGGADTNSKDENGDTSMHYAASRGVLNIVVALLEAGAKVNVINGDSPHTCYSFNCFHNIILFLS